MENHKIERIIKPMLGKFWTYQKEQHYLKNYEITDRAVKIYCDGPKSTIIILLQDFDEVIETFYTIESVSHAQYDKTAVNPYLEGSVHNTPSNILSSTVVGKNAGKLSDIIMNCIDKLQTDPNYISQAEAINSQVKSLIDLGKSEVEMLKVAAYMTKG